MGYTQIFSGTPVFPSQLSYLQRTITSSVSLQWPLETQPGASNLAGINDVVANAPGLHFNLPDASKGSLGVSTVFNNIGGVNSYAINDFSGNILATVPIGACFVIWLQDNTTQQGDWFAQQLGVISLTGSPATLAGRGLKALGITLNQVLPFKSIAVNTVLGASDLAGFVYWSAAGNGTISLTAPATLGTDWWVTVKNGGAGTVTLTPLAGQIDGGVSLPLSAGQSCTIDTDGSNFYTANNSGGAAAVGTVFQFLSINVSGNTDVTLSGAQQKPYLRFTGTLTGNINVIVPSVVAQWNVENATAGAFTLTVKTAAGTGVIVNQGQNYILDCDGTNVSNAVTAGISVPILVSQGGTGATTPSAAVTNLGGTAVGSALFTAASAANARSSLLAGTTGDAIFTAVTTANVQSILGYALGATTITAGTSLTGGGDLTANRTISVAAGGITATQIAAGTITAAQIANTTIDNSKLAAVASVSDYRGNVTGKLLTTDVVWSSGAEVAVAFASAVNLDFSTGLNFIIGAMTGPMTLGNPTNTKIGQTGYIILQQDATGGRVLTLGSNWFRQSGGGAGLQPPALGAANAADILFYMVTSKGIMWSQGKFY